MTRISIDPITRLEGHGKIEIFLDEAGEVANAYFQVPELRGFESFCVGRQAEEMPNITNRICGVCPEAHHMAAVKAVEAAYGVSCLPAARRIRELVYHAFFVADHTTHFYCLGGPDFLIGPDAPAAERNILGVLRKFGTDVGAQVIGARKRNHELIKELGGRGVHLCGGLPGGWAMPVPPERLADYRTWARANVAFAKLSLGLFDTLVMNDPAYRDLVLGDLYLHTTHSMGTVGPGNALELYDGEIRVVDTTGAELVRYQPGDYLEHLEERVEPWSYLKFPYLKRPGWQGFRDGQDSGVYLSSPLSRLNACDRIATPLAQAEFERFYDAFGARGAGTAGRNRPVHQRLATHWARLIELLYASERMVELLDHPDILDTAVRQAVEPRAGSGVGSVEAPRGTLTHHYHIDERGLLTKVNMIVGTTNNNAAMSLSIMKAARGLIHGGKVSEGILNRVEMAFRLYDPCCSCSTHALGKAPLELLVRRLDDGAVLDHLVRD
ncbi:F420-non-reducing hydrogenase subunit A, selenocysteine-containing [Geomonas limicola]|uniref:F420-non-reducing hydrogenase subunit A, selenocysteine-containing n=1 Tax=Geomonas limicola TaxID=2740186 RepID=A0A6V8N7W0_9BACT|nr:Ni/Fe hydrogenase subunit alpha [Geomonas limicola]GFO67389.1 F420-non-reducing hydrogenase subunit A, selenocysteine-containing [Geomonas limicola]